MAQYIGIDIGGTKIAVTRGKETDCGLCIVDKRVFTTDRTGFFPNWEQLCHTLDELLQSNGSTPQQTAAIGISCGGPLDSQTGQILSPPNLIGWDQIPIVKLLETNYHIPTGLQNDANACALAEWKHGSGRGYRNLVFLTFGTGMGAGLILNGALYEGANGMAGECGHIRMSDCGPVGYGKAGSFEGYCSGAGIAQLGRILVMEAFQQGHAVSFCPFLQQLNSLTARDIAEAARQGDPLALNIFRQCGKKLGSGLAILADLLNPEVIVIGSVFARSQALLWPEAEAEMRKEALRETFAACSVVPASLGEQLGDYAALSVAAMRLERSQA